jgi:glucosylceramidase
MKTICRLTLAFCLIQSFNYVFAQKNFAPVQWLTTGDSTILFKPVALQKVAATNDAPSIIIDQTKKYQTTEGFGYALTQGSAKHIMHMSAPKRTTLLHQLFDTVGDAIGVSYLRLSIGASDLNDTIYSYDDLPPGETDTALVHFDISKDKKEVLPVLKEILKVNPHITLMASPWSPPVWMKTNSDTRGGRLKPEYYGAYAKYFVKYIQAMTAENILVDAITIQNEPLHPGNNPSLLMTAPEQAEFIKHYLGPLFKQQKVKTKIIVYDHNCNRPDYPLYILNDPEAKKYVAGSGFHLYEGTTDAAGYVHDQHPDKNIYFTEQWVVQFNASRKDDEPRLNVSGIVSGLLIGATRNWSRNVLQWNLASNSSLTPFTDRGGCNLCQGGVMVDGDVVQRNLAYYTMAHFSKFVRPGAVRIASNLANNLPNVAFKNANGKIVLVVANTSNIQQVFNLKFGTANTAVSLPAQSVATYVF